MEKNECIEFTDRELQCFSSAIRFIMLNDEKWRLTSATRKSELIKESCAQFLTNPLEEKTGCQAFANALYWLLQQLGHEKGEIGPFWAETLRHAVCDDAFVSEPLISSGVKRPYAI